MSVTGHSVPSEFKISLQRRNYSGELDVFEATQYFSSANENPAGCNSPNLGQNPVKNVRRMSLDMPKSNVISPQNQIPEKQMKENKKYKQPSSPGARIASFLNSLFNQKSAKKKKLKSGGTINQLEVEDPGDHRRRRRSSISHFPVSNSAVDSKSIYSTSSSGFTTPHVYANTPTKLYKEFRSFSDPLQHAISVPKTSENFKPGFLRNEKYDVQRSTDYAWLDEKLSLRNNEFSAKVLRNGSSEFSDHKKFSTNYWVDKYSSEGSGEFRKFSHGGDSDSSSDLFDLPNHDLDFCSSTGLPVYETTQMDRIKKSALISSTETV